MQARAQGQTTAVPGTCTCTYAGIGTCAEAGKQAELGNGQRRKHTLQSEAQKAHSAVYNAAGAGGGGNRQTFTHTQEQEQEQAVVVLAQAFTHTGIGTYRRADGTSTEAGRAGAGTYTQHSNFKHYEYPN
ncbi:hypothetical protein NEPAR04_2224 [Nematocida parisii]|nr:hypothetical protein NEPAR04_2224 [Nematocida parisii]KAI5168174.1 hypothetical protein NEIRO02_2446 [Nematocida sp. AWRm79]